MSCDNPHVQKIPHPASGLLLIGAASVPALHQAAVHGADEIAAGKPVLESLLRVLAALAPASGARLGWQFRDGRCGAAGGSDGAALLQRAGFAAAAPHPAKSRAHGVIAGLARDPSGDYAAAVLVPGEVAPQPSVLSTAALSPGAGLCAGDWGAAVILGDDDALWALSPARKLADALQLHEPAGAGRDLMLLARAHRTEFRFAALTAAGEFVWGSPDGELPRAWAGDGPPPHQSRAEKR